MLSTHDRNLKGTAVTGLRKLRIRNLRLLIEHLGSSAELARRLAVSDAYVAQIAGPNPTRDIGEQAARSIEAKLGLPAGWLDVDRRPSRTAPVTWS